MPANTILVDSGKSNGVTPALYTLLREQLTGLWANTDPLVQALETWNGANYGNYAVPFVEVGGPNTSGLQLLTVPLWLPPGAYDLVGRERAGGNPSTNDIPRVPGSFLWNGVAISQVQLPVATATQPVAVPIMPLAEAGLLTMLRGDDWTQVITNLGPLTGDDKLWFTAKFSKSDQDPQSVIQIVRTNVLSVVNSSLVVLNGAPAPRPADGALAVTDYGGTITITVKAASVAEMPTADLYYDLQIMTGGVIRTLTMSQLLIPADVTRAVL